MTDCKMLEIMSAQLKWFRKLVYRDLFFKELNLKQKGQNYLMFMV